MDLTLNEHCFAVNMNYFQVLAVFIIKLSFIEKHWT